MTKRGWVLIAGIVALIAAASVLLFTHRSRIDWQSHANPGELSRAHAILGEKCESCHTPIAGVDRNKCVACHANNEALVQRQPTAFHAVVTECTTCHREHQGVTADLRAMNHAEFARIALRDVSRQSDASAFAAHVRSSWLDGGHTSSESNAHTLESLLNCAGCHGTVDKHQGLFGATCSDCHASDRWTIQRFRHPSASSTDCNECHQAPPSHYMMHFEMVSKKVARQEDERVSACCGVAQVEQCYRCHQTTSWNDIKGVGWYKHH